MLTWTHGKGFDLHGREKTIFRLVRFIIPFCLVISVVTSLSGLAQGEEPDPRQGKHLFEYYCAVCHGVSGRGDGLNADHLGDVHPTDLTESGIDKLDDEEIYETIEGGGAAIDISYYMPPWGNVFSPEQINDLVAYIRTLSEANGTRLSDVVRFVDLKKTGDEKCLVCHSKETTSLRPIGPNIGHEGSKLKKEWLTQFLKQPERLRPIGYVPFSKAKMPNFYFTDEEVDALVAYLMTLKDEGIQPNVLAGWDPTDPAEIENGEFLFIEQYACDGCHKRSSDGEGGIVGPELSYALERIRPEWLFYWIKNPQAIRPDTPMPNFNMPDGDIRSILAFLYSVSGTVPVATTVADEPMSDPELLKKGKKIVETKNCMGCHLIDSFNSQIDRENRVHADEEPSKEGNKG